MLTRAIIDTIREPLIVLDEKLCIIAASRSFYKKFGLVPEETQDKLFYEIGNGQWNIPALRALLEQVIPTKTAVEGYQVDCVFPGLGERIVLVNAREVRYDNGRKKMLLSIFDITEQRALESEKEQLILQKDLLLKEMRHRIANSLQLIASILLIKGDSMDSKESRSHFVDAHERILSIATAQKQLDPVEHGEEIAVGPYLTLLCQSLARSMISRRNQPVTLEVIASDGSATPDIAVSFGLLTTELVINALKHAFPNNQSGNVLVSYEASSSGWSLSIADDGVGQSQSQQAGPRGLGTSIIGAIANQLQAIIRTESSPKGTKVSITHTID